MFPFPPSRGIHPPSVSSLVTLAVPDFSLRGVFPSLAVFVSAFHLLYSFRGSLFFHWSFFLYAVSGCFGVFRSVRRSDLRFPFATGSPVGTGPFSFLMAPSALPPVASSVPPPPPWFLYFFLCQGFTLFLRLFAWIRSSLFCCGKLFPPFFLRFLCILTSWGRRHGHSISRPSILKIAYFLLYLRRSLSLSYSSIASYRSMLSGVFRFVLLELSSHFVLRDLLRSFRLGRPVSSFRVPP